MPIPSIRCVEQNLRLLRRCSFGSDGRAINCVAARWIATVRPIENAVLDIEFQINRFRQVVKQDLDVGPIGGSLSLRNLDVRAEDAAHAGIVASFLCPVDVPALGIDGDSDAPLGLVLAVCISLAGLDESLDLRSVEVAAHDPHPLTVAPVQPAARLLQVKLLRRMRASLGDNCRAIASVEIGALIEPSFTPKAPMLVQ